MDFFWLIPLGVVALIGIWAFHSLVGKSHKSCIRTTGRVLYDRPDPDKPDNPPPC